MRALTDTRIELPGYELMHPLGEGASGVVYQARQRSTGQSVAVKLLRTADGSQGEGRDRLEARFAREMQLCAQLHHPHIVRLLDQGRSLAGQLYAVFEFVPGATLGDLILRQGALSAPLAGDLMLQVLDALATAHAAGIVHRDLKPMNIMASWSGTRLHAKVLDFGLGVIAPVLGQSAARDLTLSSEILGTPRYCAPEQLRGSPPTVKSDLYAWGLTLLECLTGVAAVQGTTLAEVHHQHLSAGDVPLPPALLQHPLGALLRGVLRKDPKSRGPSAVELYERAKAINWSGLVGSLKGEGRHDAGAAALDATSVAGATQERRQITMLGFCVEATASASSVPDTEAQEEWLRHQVDRCHDTCMAYGGYPAGTFGTMRLVYFGYPLANDGAARHAARACLALLAQIAEDMQPFENFNGVRLTARAALHTTVVVARTGQVPMGIEATALARLMLQGEPGQVCVSEGARRLLEGNFGLREDRDLATGAARCFIEGAQDALVAGRVESPVEDDCWVGRQHELAALVDLWHAVKRGETRVGGVQIVGEAGIGKSRLTMALCEQVRRERGTAWVLHCLPEQRSSALYPFLRWLRTWLQPSGEAGPGASPVERLQTLVAGSKMSVAEVVPILGSWLGLPLPPSLARLPHAPGRQKKIAIDSLIQLLFKLAGGPLMLVVEDVHWIDPTSRELLDRLLADDGAHALGVVLTGRPEEDHRPLLDTLVLQGLGAEDATELVQRLSKVDTLTAPALARLVARAEGNPLYLSELARAQGRLGGRGAPDLEAAQGVPASLRDVLVQTLDRVGSAKETAQLAAAMGREFDHALLRAASARQGPELQNDLNELVAAGVVERRPASEGGVYAFRHVLIRDAAYDSLTRESRQVMHSRIADALLQQPQIRPADVAHHHAGAGVYDQAVAYATDAARTALERSLHEETRALCKQALSWNGVRADSSFERAQAELALNRILLPALSALRGLGSPELLALSERDAALIELVSKQRPADSELAHSEQNWREECLAFQATHFGGDCARTIAMGEALLGRIKAKGERQAQLHVLPLLAQAHHWAGDLATAETRFHEALDLYAPDEDREMWIEHVLDPRCQALFLLSHALAYGGRIDEARRCIADCSSWARELGCVNAQDGGVFFGALTDYLCNDRQAIDDAAAAHQAAHANATEDQWLVAGWRMVFDWSQGRTAHTRGFIEGSLSAGYGGAMCWFEVMLAETEISQGLVDDGIQRLRQSIDRCERNGEVATLPIQYMVLADGLILAEGGMRAATEQHFRTALDISRRHGSDWLGLRVASAYAAALERQDRREDARRVLEPLTSRITQGRRTPVFRQACIQLQALCETAAMAMPPA